MASEKMATLGFWLNLAKGRGQETIRGANLLSAVNVVLRAGSLLLVIRTAGSVYSVPVCENVRAGRAETA